MSVAVTRPRLRPKFDERLHTALATRGPSLVGIAAMAALIPARGTWAAGLVLLALAFTVPGVLLLRALRISGDAVRAYPPFIPAASLVVMLVAGLLANEVGPHVGIAQPLRGDTTALTVIGISLGLWVIGLPAPSAARVQWRRLLESPSLLAPLVLPLVAAGGALLLSNQHSPAVARIADVLVAASLLGAVGVAPRLSRGQLAMLLFSCSLAAEWAFSLRSQEVVGFDITTEIAIAQHIQATGVWNSLHRGDAYGAMLSVTVLPSTLASLTGVAPLIAFKVVFPALTALLPVSIFFYGERFMRPRFAAGAAALLIVQTYFFQQLPQLARQEIALVFFAALIAALLDARMRTRPRLGLIALLSAGVVASHYSSTYLAIPIVIGSLVLSLILGRFRPVGMSGRLLCATIVLVGGAALWYGAVTHSSSNLTSFTASLQRNGLDLLPNGSGNVISTYLNGTQGVSVPAPAYEQLLVNNYQARGSYIHPLPQSHERQFNLAPVALAGVPRKRLQTVALGLQWFSVLFSELMLVLGVLGAVVMVLGRRVSRRVRQVGVLALSTVGVLVLIRFSGTVASSYNQTRALAQSLLLLAMPAAWLTQHVLDRVSRIRTVAGVALLLAFPIMFLYNSSLTAVVTGGGTLLNLSQSGEDFQRQYMTPAEVSGAAWATQASYRHLLYADPYAQLRLNDSTGAVALNEVAPETLDRRAWLYGDRTNVVLGVTRAQAGSDSSTYAWPNSYLDDYYDTMFNDGDSKVYHR